MGKIRFLILDLPIHINIQLELPNKRIYLNDVLKGCSILTKNTQTVYYKE